MALHKEPYGLVYNDDGSLCVTLRKDDIPFEGVTSFAVEEGTENLVCEALRYQSSTSAYGTCTKGATAGKTYALSGRVKVDADGHWFRIYLYKSGWGWSDYLEWNKTQYETKAKVITLPNDGGTYYMSFFAGPRNSGCTAYIDWLQVEQKPFATSFVDGSRPRGKLHIPSNSLGFNPPTDDWVIAYWKKPIRTHTGDLNGYNIDSLGKAVSGNLYVWWGKHSGDSTLWLNVYNGSSHQYVITSLDTDDFFNKWHFIVLAKVGNVFTLYYDGEQTLRMTIDVSSLTMPSTGLLLGDWAANSDKPCTSLFSNLYIGKAKIGDNLIWDDSYIQQLYQAKRPFSVPPKMPVM